ncbi:MAG: hypothetical protein CMB34_05145 [Euryarchaeota archaeon]|nr:hypothetical protein [Euryarchaeota archaeon]|tara:strand:+ start:1900 stop:2124 length:225 start_codon:yes stop_codon:yes gene_type:complete
MDLHGVKIRARALGTKVEDLQYMLENAQDRNTIDLDRFQDPDLWFRMIKLVEEAVIALGRVEELATLHITNDAP